MRPGTTSTAASILLAACIAFGFAPTSRADAEEQRNGRISLADPVTSQQIIAMSAPKVGQVNVLVEETIHLHHFKSFCMLFFCDSSNHDVDYFFKRRQHAEWVDGLQKWILNDDDGHWFELSPGATNFAQIRGKPSYSIGNRDKLYAEGDRFELTQVLAYGTHLVAYYNVIHSEPVYEITYKWSKSYDTTLVHADLGDFYMAWIDETSLTRREYGVRDGWSQDVVRFDEKPLLTLGQKDRADLGDSLYKIDIVNISEDDPLPLVIMQKHFTSDRPFVTVEYYVTSQAYATYSSAEDIWSVGDIVILFGDDPLPTNQSGTIVRAPSQFKRPQIAVHGGGVIPGRPEGSYPRRDDKDCIGDNCGAAPITTPSSKGNNCVQGVDAGCGSEPMARPSPQGNTCIQGVDDGC